MTLASWWAQRRLDMTRAPRVPGDEPTHSRRRRSVGIVVTMTLVAGLLVSTGVRLFTAAAELRDAERTISLAAEAIKDGRIEDARTQLAAAEASLSDVNDRLRTAPELTVISIVPIVKENLQSVRDSVELAAVVVHGGRRILRSADGLEGEDGTLQVSLADGSIEIDAIETARDEIEALLVQMSASKLSSSSRFLLPAAREVRDAVIAAADEQRGNLDRLRRGLVLLDQLVGADQPRRLLIAVANTAEMRGSGGMMLNYGVLQGDNGTIDLTAFGRVEELVVSTPVAPDSVGLPDDFSSRWDGFAPTQEWRNTTLSGDFTLTAPALLAMYQRSTGVPADGVIQVDPSALAGLLSVVGPVVIDEVGVVTADNVEALVLNEAYRRFPGVEERSDVLGDVAEATFEALVAGEYPSVRDLAGALADAVAGRHLLAYSAASRAESAIGYFSADGALPDAETLDYAHLTVQNMSGNKLDYYVDSSVAFTGTRLPGEVGSVTAKITVANNAPIGETEPRYIFGPFDDDQAVGVYRTAVSLYLPAGTSLDSASGAGLRIEPALMTEDGRPLVSFWADIPAGQSREVTLELTMAPIEPGADYDFMLVPAPRIRPTSASVDLDLGDGRRIAGEVVMDRTWVLDESGAVSVEGF